MKELLNSKDSPFTPKPQAPFTVPSGYFDTLPERIINFCQQSKPEQPVIGLFQTLRTQLALAAGFAAMVVLGYAGFFHIQQPKTANPGLTNNDYIDIVSKRISDFDEGQLVVAGSINGSLDTVKLQKNDEMIQYLLEENIDYVTLMENMPR